MNPDELLRPRTPPRAPAGLRRGGDGRRLWAGVLSQYALRPDEAVALRCAVQTIDELERLRDELAASPHLLIKGGRGSVISHPHLVEVRKHRAVLVALLAAVGLGEAGGSGSEASQAGRGLVNKRWSNRKGG